MMLPLLCFSTSRFEFGMAHLCFIVRFSTIFNTFSAISNRTSIEQQKPTEDVVYVHSFGTSNQTTLKHMQLSKVRKNKRANFFFSSSFPLLLLWRLASSKCTHHTSSSVLFSSFLILLYCYYCLITFPSCKTKNLEVRSSSKDA